jgi:hypothetical protein
VAPFDEFITTLETVPKLLSDLALGVSIAQQRMDLNYLRDLRALMEMVAPLLKDSGKLDEFTALFKAIGPSRYQFTTTSIEVRADLQTSVGQQFGAGITVPMAVAINASYARRTASDVRASAVIRSVLHAVSADPATMQALLSAAKDAPTTELPKDLSPAQQAIQEALTKLAGTTAAGQLPEKAAGADSGGGSAAAADKTDAGGKTSATDKTASGTNSAGGTK